MVSSCLCAVQNVAAQWEAVIRSAASPPTQVGPWVELPSNPAADPTGLNQLQLWQYNYNTLVLVSTRASRAPCRGKSSAA